MPDVALETGGDDPDSVSLPPPNNKAPGLTVGGFISGGLAGRLGWWQSERVAELDGVAA